MALRFRRSITLFPGVKINIGKTGPSLSVGVPGFRKTYHTDGRVTTTVGLPGTGLSWTETSRPNQQRNVSAPERPVRPTETREEYVPPAESRQNVVPARRAEETSNVAPRVERPVRKSNNYLSAANIKSIYTGSDDEIDWAEIAAGADAEELLMDEGTWKYCSKVANKIIRGDIDTYLETIENLRPVDDLLLYGCDFEFGTDKSSYMEVEFNAKAEELLPQGLKDALFEELVCGTSIRVAKDIMAMLPVSRVIVHSVIAEKTVLSVLFEKKNLVKVDYRNMSAKAIVMRCKNSYGINNGCINDVVRLEL